MREEAVLGGEASSQVLQDPRAPTSRQAPLGAAFSGSCGVCRTLGSGAHLLATAGTAVLRPWERLPGLCSLLKSPGHKHS